MTYALGQKSLAELTGVHPKLVGVVKRAIQLTTQDFTVHDGLRTNAEQAENVKRGVSWTMDTKHAKQADGFGHAVDLVPWIDGKPQWLWAAIYPIAVAMRLASAEQGVKLRWGGTWGGLDDIPATNTAMANAVAAYVAARKKAGKRASIDGVHYEIGG